MRIYVVDFMVPGILRKNAPLKGQVQLPALAGGYGFLGVPCMGGFFGIAGPICV